MKRRLLLQSLAGVTLCGAAVGEPFPWGVASGDPWPDGVVLWTRTVMPGTVRWEVAEDEAFARVVQKGSVKAEAVHAHAVHVTVRGLKAGRWYWYRFMAAAGKSDGRR
jgi:alkaline phosphatase D